MEVTLGKPPSPDRLAVRGEGGSAEPRGVGRLGLTVAPSHRASADSDGCVNIWATGAVLRKEPMSP